jgi:GDP-mannose 6-dehydrogenase
MHPLSSKDWSEGPDFDKPGPIIIGELDKRSGEAAMQLYATTNASLGRTSIQTAEMLNYVNKALHAVHLTFANEIGNLCAAHGIDGHKVMKHSCLDQRVNPSEPFLRPEFAFDGPYFPKDLRALVYRAKEQDVDCPLLNAALLSNQSQIAHSLEMVERTGRSRIGIFGFGFKATAADIRENLTVHLAEILVGKGYSVRIFHENTDQTRPGDIATFLLDCSLPHIAKLLSSSLQEFLQQTEVVVIANSDTAGRNVPGLLMNDQILIDLAGVGRELAQPQHF